MVDHWRRMPAQLEKLGIEQVDYGSCCSTTPTRTFPIACRARQAARRSTCTIVENSKAGAGRTAEGEERRVSLGGFMFTLFRLFGTPDMIEQHKLRRRWRVLSMQ